MNSISTSPLIFNEEYNSLLCLFRGNKRIVLVNTKKYPDVRQVSQRTLSILLHSVLILPKIVAPDNQKPRRPPFNPEQ